MTYLDTLKAFKKPEVASMLFLGFSAGLPFFLVFGTLSLWLREAGLERSTVTYFSWAVLGYSFKFVWAPLIDKLPIPVLTNLFGKRRSWLLFSQVCIVLAILLMAMSDPSHADGLVQMAIGAVCLGFASATQDIALDAYRIEIIDVKYQALMSSTYIAGYRIGMMIAGAFALYLAETLGSTKDVYSFSAWQNTYFVMACFMLVGIISTLIVKEPKHSKEKQLVHSGIDYLRFSMLFISMAGVFILSYIFLADPALQLKESLSTLTSNTALQGFLSTSMRLLSSVLCSISMGILLTKCNIVPKQMLHDTYIEPTLDFFIRYKKAAVLILLVIGLYRTSDIVLGAIANVFYQDMGFSKTQIGAVTKGFGLFMTILGGFLGGILSIRFGIMKTLMLGAVMTVATNLLFILLANTPEMWLLYFVISADNITGGLASAALVGYLSSLVNIQFTAMQYAIFSSLMTLFPKIIAGYSGSMVDTIGYQNFFLFASLLGVPIFFLILLANKFTVTKENSKISGKLA